MGLEFLTRVRQTTIALGAIAALFVTTYRGPALGLAVALGVAWSLVNLMLLQALVLAITGEHRGSRGALERAGLVVAGMLALFGAGGVMLLMLPPAALVLGFMTPFAVMVLKATALLVLPSRGWRRLVGSPWLAVGAVGVLVIGLWAAAASFSGSARAAAHASNAQPASDALTQVGSQTGSEAAPGTEPAAHAAGPAHAAKSESGPQKFPNLITYMEAVAPHTGWVEFLHHYEAIAFSFLIALILCVVAFVATRSPQLVPGPLQNAVEAIVEALYDFVVGILGPRHGRRYIPFLGTLFVYIMAMNLFGLIPGMDSPTSSLNVTLALALTVFLFAQYIGFKELGLLGYIDHMAGNPRSALSWGLVVILLPIHVLGELAKPISLSCRLFGNIFGEDMLLVAFASLGVTVLSFTHLPFGLPLQLPFLFLALLTSTLQALVFTVLSTIYFLLMLPHDEHAHEHGHGAEAHAHP